MVGQLDHQRIRSGGNGFHHIFSGGIYQRLLAVRVLLMLSIDHQLHLAVGAFRQIFQRHAAAEALKEAGIILHLDGCFPADGLDAVSDLLRHDRRGDNDEIDPVLFNGALQVLHAVDHGDAVQERAEADLLVVEGAHRTDGFLPLQLLKHDLAGPACADDHCVYRCTFPVICYPDLFHKEQPVGKPARGDETRLGKRAEAVEGNGHSYKGRSPEQDESSDDVDDKADHVCPDDAVQVVEARVLPDAAVQVEAAEDHETENGVIGRVAGIGFDILRRGAVELLRHIKSGQQRKITRGIHRNDVIHDQ